jgi:hypothetical protein
MDDVPVMPDNPSISPPRDFTVPRQPRKRRRPALSCNECRRRKVKCDQKVPCTPCTKSKTAVCKYDPDATPKGKIYSPSFNTTSKILPKHARENVTVRNSNSQAIAPTAIGTLLPNIISQETIATSKHSSNNSTIGEAPPGQSVQELNDRIRQLEKMVTSMINTKNVQSSENDFDCPNNYIVPQLKGSTHKSRFFTTSHWMNTKKEVSSSHTCV